MRETQASKTASWVAAARSFGAFLPPDCQLCDDPYGVRFAAPWLQSLERAFRRFPGLGQQLLLRARMGVHTVLYLQLRTRIIDDALLDFAESGGQQVVLLGAGFDCRAKRFERQLADVDFFEVDHPATQAVKRRVVGDFVQGHGRFVPWDFGSQPLEQLPSALAGLGHRRDRRSLTIWEGVTMYLDEAAIEASFRAIRDYCTPGSRLAFTYFDRRVVEQPTRRQRLLRRLVASVGEPFRFGWSPAELPAWLEKRGFRLLSDVDDAQSAERHFPPELQRYVRGDGRHFALAETLESSHAPALLARGA